MVGRACFHRALSERDSGACSRGNRPGQNAANRAKNWGRAPKHQPETTEQRAGELNAQPLSEIALNAQSCALMRSSLW